MLRASVLIGMGQCPLSSLCFWYLLPSFWVFFLQLHCSRNLRLVMKFWFIFFHLANAFSCACSSIIRLCLDQLNINRDKLVSGAQFRPSIYDLDDPNLMEE